MYTPEKQAFLSLIRLGVLPNAVEAPIFDNVNLNALYAEITKHGMEAITNDGLQRLLDMGYKRFNDNIQNKQLLLEWVGKTIQIETQSSMQYSAAVHMSKVLSDNNIKTVVLKGIVVSECYLKPLHRYSSDLDCFLINNEDHFAAYEEGNKIMESCGCTVDRSYYKNSSYYYRGLHVENHRFCTPFRGNKSLRRFEKLLQKMLLEDTCLKPIEGTNLYRPSSLFTAIFLIEHSYSHFLHEGLTLKQILDWALFKRKNINTIDWGRFLDICRECGFERFVKAISNLGAFILGELEFNELNSIEIRIMDDVWKGALTHNMPRFKLHLALIKETLCSGWKYKYFSNINIIQALLIQLYGVFFEKNPRLN
jgi:hypothetical protein